MKIILEVKRPDRGRSQAFLLHPHLPRVRPSPARMAAAGLCPTQGPILKALQWSWGGWVLMSEVPMYGVDVIEHSRPRKALRGPSQPRCWSRYPMFGVISWAFLAKSGQNLYEKVTFD